MADMTRGWTSSTVIPLYLRNTLPPSVTSAVSGLTARTPTSTTAQPAAPLAASTYKYASQVSPEALTAQSAQFAATPEKVYGLEDFRIAPGDLKDPSLGSRQFMTAAQVRPVDVGAQASTFQSANVPAFLQSQIAQLNAEQYQKRSAQQDLLDRLFSAVQGGDYTAWEALRAAAVQPGARAAFGAGIVSPELQAAQTGATRETAKKTAAETAAISLPAQLSRQMQQAQAARAQLGQTSFGAYTGSAQEKLDQQILNLRSQLRGLGSQRSAWVAPMNLTY